MAIVRLAVLGGLALAGALIPAPASADVLYYVGDYWAASVLKVSSSGPVVQVATGISVPEGLAFDSAGNLYIASQGSNVIDKLSPSGTLTQFASGFDAPIGIGFDS